MKNIYFIISFLFLIISCRTTSENTLLRTESTVNSEIIKASIKISDQQSYPIEILESTIVGNLLILKVAYGGGCKDHSFELIGSPEISKSLPPIRTIKLIHKSNNDLCKAMVYKTLKIDISDLAYQKIEGSTIILQGEQFKDKLTYSYKGD